MRGFFLQNIGFWTIFSLYSCTAYNMSFFKAKLTYFKTIRNSLPINILFSSYRYWHSLQMLLYRRGHYVTTNIQMHWLHTEPLKASEKIIKVGSCFAIVHNILFIQACKKRSQINNETYGTSSYNKLKYFVLNYFVVLMTKIQCSYF